MTELTVNVREEDGTLWAEVEELPGCFASGADLNELAEAVREAIRLYQAPSDEELREIARSAFELNLAVSGLRVTVEDRDPQPV